MAFSGIESFLATTINFIYSYFSTAVHLLVIQQVSFIKPYKYMYLGMAPCLRESEARLSKNQD